MRTALILAGAAILATGGAAFAQQTAPTTDSATREGKVTAPDSGMARPDRGMARLPSTDDSRRTRGGHLLRWMSGRPPGRR